MRVKLLTLFILFIGCTKAPGPTLVIDRAKLKGVKKIASLPVTSVTPVKEITTLVEQTFKNELSVLKRYKCSETKEEVRPQEVRPQNGMTKEDYTILACLSGVSALGYYIYQIWKLNDDVVIYNYKLKFLKSTFLELNLSKPLFTLALAKEF